MPGSTRSSSHNSRGGGTSAGAARHSTRSQAPGFADPAHEGRVGACATYRIVLLALAAAAVVVAAVHGAFFKDFVFVSFDGETARSMGYPVAWLNAALNLTIAVAVAMATRAMGTLPVFTFLVLPAGAALLFAKRLWRAMVLSVAIVVLSAIGGYYLSCGCGCGGRGGAAGLPGRWGGELGGVPSCRSHSPGRRRHRW
jgi:hypothetical protein